ncbi:uncharacterized protein Z518_03890 [Rhinocladiella mackenziei CBS 650.93]|uniref:BRCT domain-containing protein n=1 Tax=Rhinocladiella mackenziei CBS 650.93 TaxID=1442369 RepID=A0A0D2IS02_9EURO|nr:uncharacterized protein Z518_03890 [Rhinocladiella mackenziei CBS 650.93]KIX05916.1 hypothetical protein Z518_03890 [Rhinocladiella mackenziei CBS 650.93]
MTALESSHTLNLKSVPPIFILPTHLQPQELHETEDSIFKAGGSLTYDPKEARIFIGRINQKKRAAFELRARGIWTEEATLPEPSQEAHNEGPTRKKRKVSMTEDSVSAAARSISTSPGASVIDTVSLTFPPRPFWPDLTNRILILKISWLEACLKQAKLVPYKPYVIYNAKVISKPTGPMPETGSTSSPSRPTPNVTATILQRAQAEASTLPSSSSPYTSRRRLGNQNRQRKASSSTRASPPTLHRTTTSEMEFLAEHPLPPLPDWASGPNASYACCRSTPIKALNEAFIAQLIKIREARLLTLDDIGVRAYSTSIASISAYPHRIMHTEEITRLPGCDAKIAALWNEWQHSASEDPERYLQTVRDLDNDTDLAHLRIFWNIWGVGPDTARKFYFQYGWRDLDDVVEYGWHSLTRTQQIGVKFYDEFQNKIPRAEVEAIRDVIKRHARDVLDIPRYQFGTKDDVECIVVGGYRRGKELSGDVDVILSHRDENKTQDLVVDVVHSLEAEGWITHTLTLHTMTSDRGQATLPFHGKKRGHSFDSLDKALCVWQDPHFETSSKTTRDVNEGGEGGEEGEVPQRKNPNIHRRVDIIISPWRTIGCAVLGWSGGTTFQRDVRRFVSKAHGWKFDSSGVRDRVSGLVLDLEGPRPRGPEAIEKFRISKGISHSDSSPVPAGSATTKPSKNSTRRSTVGNASKGMKGTKSAPIEINDAESDGGRVEDADMDDADTWHDRERRLMEAMGIGYRPPEERCTN